MDYVKELKEVHKKMIVIRKNFYETERREKPIEKRTETTFFRMVEAVEKLENCIEHALVLKYWEKEDVDW